MLCKILHSNYFYLFLSFHSDIIVYNINEVVAFCGFFEGAGEDTSGTIYSAVGQTGIGHLRGKCLPPDTSAILEVLDI